MNCPHCKKEMVLKNKDVSRNSQNSKEYDKTIYICEADDIWISIEIPIKT